MKISTHKIDPFALGYESRKDWTIWYKWDKVKKVIKFGNIIMPIVLSIISIIITKTLTKDINILQALIILLIYLLLIVPFHEILHLFAESPNIFSKKCRIAIGVTTFSASFDGEVTRKQHLICLLSPCVSITIILLIILIFFHTLLPYILFILVMNLGGSWTDIYIFFYILKNVPKQAIIYGNRYKIY